MRTASILLGAIVLVAALVLAVVWAVLENIKLRTADLSLQRDNHLFTALLENTNDSIYFKDINSRFIRCSRVMLNRFDVNDPASIVDKSDRDFFTEEHAVQALQDEQEIIRSGIAVVKEEKETWPDGSETWVSTAKMPLRDAAERIIGTFGISR